MTNTLVAQIDGIAEGRVTVPGTKGTGSQVPGTVFEVATMGSTNPLARDIATLANLGTSLATGRPSSEALGTISDIGNVRF